MSQFNTQYFDVIDTEQKAYILGFLQGDGSFSCKGRIEGYYRYKLAIQELDIHILESMQKEMNHTGHLMTQYAKFDHHQNLIELSLNGIEFTRKLRNIFGGYKKEERTNFPILKPELVRHFIRGVLDADGSLGDYDGVMLRIEGKQQFLESIKGITGFNFNIAKGNGKTTYTARLHGFEAIHFIEWAYGDLSTDSLFLHRKYNTAKSLLENRGIQFKEAS